MQLLFPQLLAFNNDHTRVNVFSSSSHVTGQVSTLQLDLLFKWCIRTIVLRPCKWFEYTHTIKPLQSDTQWGLKTCWIESLSVYKVTLAYFDVVTVPHKINGRIRENVGL